MPGIFEVEEFVGRHWDRLVGNAASYPVHPQHAVTLDSLRSQLGVFYRGLGGERSVRLAGGVEASSEHRLSFRQRLGLGIERLDKPRREGDSIVLPTQVAVFPDAELNRKLYYWLAAYFAHHQEPPAPPGHALAADIAFLRGACRTTDRVLAACPGLRTVHAALGQALREVRPRRGLPRTETEVEAIVRAMLGGEAAAGPLWQAVTGGGPIEALARVPHYKPFLPVPLWGEAIAGPDKGQSRGEQEDNNEARGAQGADGRRRKASRRNTEHAERKDSFILNRFDKILSMMEMLDINRKVEDDDEEGAKKAADDAEEIVVSQNSGKPATKLKFDLDLPPDAVDESAIQAELSYPEWDYTKQLYRRDYCRVVAGKASEEGEDWTPDLETRKRIRQVRRQFEALRPKHELLRAQVDGNELDIEAVVRSRCDLKASGQGSDCVHQASRKQSRDLAVALLVDVSLSTDAWFENRRVLDVEKEALTVLAHGLSACGDDHAILTFTSRKRNWVRVQTVKDFDEPLTPAVTRRISALKPGFYTRMGAAIRHASHVLAERPNRHKLLVVLTDGKPNDVDHYEGRYGIEDTRRAILDARRAGTNVFGVTVDKEAQNYFPVLFGRGGYAIVNHISRLPAALPKLYRQLVGN